MSFNWRQGPPQDWTVEQRREFEERTRDALMFLIGTAARTENEQNPFTITEVLLNGVPIGDWEVSVKLLKAPASGPNKLQ